jgi:hypothetical protein
MSGDSFPLDDWVGSGVALEGRTVRVAFRQSPDVLPVRADVWLEAGTATVALWGRVREGATWIRHSLEILGAEFQLPQEVERVLQGRGSGDPWASVESAELQVPFPIPPEWFRGGR